MNSMLFHPNEIAFCGYSGSGKTTLIAEIVTILSAKFTIAYYKHGCHHFDVDRKGKDSWTIGRAGASTVMISDPEKRAIITRHDSLSTILEQQAFSDHDMLFVEGLKELPLPKLLLVDAEHRILDLLSNGKLSSVTALVVPDDPARYASFSIPVLHRECTSEIAAFIENTLLTRSLQKSPLYGLVLAGGHSSRMGSDKALITYHKENQLLHTASLLQRECSHVFISCREEQSETYRHYGIPLITDCYLGIGPLGGVLSAQQTKPQAAWLVAACDLPFLDETVTRQLRQQRNPMRFATAFRNPESSLLEPLSACYEPKSRSRLLIRHSTGSNSLSSFLEESPVEELIPQNALALRNINDPEGRQAAAF